MSDGPSKQIAGASLHSSRGGKSCCVITTRCVHAFLRQIKQFARYCYQLVVSGALTGGSVNHNHFNSSFTPGSAAAEALARDRPQAELNIMIKIKLSFNRH